MVFGSRRTWIEPDHFERIARDDGYRHVDDAAVEAGDLVAYVRPRGEVVHVGLVVERRPNLERAVPRFSVISKFGKFPEYIHDHDDLPSDLYSMSDQRLVAQFWSERKQP